MATYYKYAERDADSQVNYAEIGKNMSDMLAETNRVREEKKAAIDKATRETLNELANSPNGEHTGARMAALEYADQASNFVRIQENLLKRGQISLKDYTVFRQNLNDGTDLAFNAVKVYQENYAESMQRYRDGKASLYEIRKREQGEGFGNWNQSGLYINPANGKVMAAMKTKKVIDGKEVFTMDDAPGKMASVDWINGMLIGKWDKYDYATPVKDFTSNLGEEKKTAIKLGGITRQGKITSVEDITSRKDIDPTTKQELFRFIDAENNAIDAVLGTPANKFSILADHAKTAPNGKPYDITNDPEAAKKNSNLVLEVIDPNTGQGAFQFTKEQDADAKEFIRSQMRAQYDYKEEASAVGAVARDEESEGARAGREKDKESETAANMIGKLYYGDNNEAGSAVDYFKGMKNADGEVLFKKVVRDNTGVTVTLKNGTTEKISFTDANGKPRTQEDFIRSAGPLLAGQLDVNKALEKGSYAKDKKFNPNSRASGSTIEKFKASPDIVSLSSQDAYRSIQSSLPDGFTAEDTGDALALTANRRNQVTITGPSGKKYIVQTKKSGEDALGVTMGLEDFVNKEISSSGTTSSGGTVTGGNPR
jgi:hypothetical protein